MGGRDGDSTMLHEYGHRHEDGQRRLKSTIQEFYGVRTAGEPLVDLHTIYPWFKEGEEYTRLDKFADAYIGKLYSDGGTEVLTMGLQGVFFNKYNLLSKDVGHYDFILGLLVGI